MAKQDEILIFHTTFQVFEMISYEKSNLYLG